MTIRNNRFLLLVLLMACTAFFGELKMIPFGQNFRFSLGTPCYLFGLIWFRQLRPLESGICVGLFLLLFRCFLDMQSYGGEYWSYAPQHIPSTVYYVIVASVLTLTNFRDRLDRPLQVGLIGMIGDMTGNIGELLTRNWFGAGYTLDTHTLFLLFLFGMLRSFFVVGVYNMLMIRQLRLLGEQQKEQIDRLLLINSSLYEEGFYLQKSMREIEDITRHSYDLYKQLKVQAPALSRHALQIAEEVHELKKDSQRVLAGLDKLMKQETFSDRMPLREIGELVVDANRKYAQMLGKQIEFTLLVDVDLTTSRIYELISILNNLVANSVEAIQERGHIDVGVQLADGRIEWHVLDNGPGIAAEDADYVFQPGYTTKYDSQGNPSTGIGLTHCQDLATMLGGDLTLRANEELTWFVMRMPTSELLQREKEAERRD